MTEKDKNTLVWLLLEIVDLSEDYDLDDLETNLMKISAFANAMDAIMSKSWEGW